MILSTVISSGFMLREIDYSDMSAEILTLEQKQCDVCLHQAGRAKDEVLFRMKATQGKREPNREHD